MIDTVRFKIPVDLELFNRVKKLSIETRKIDNPNQKIIIQNINQKIELATSNRSISLFTYDEERLYVECSLPKLIYGGNVRLLYPSMVEEALRSLHKILSGRFGAFPSYKVWPVVRLDLCYAWRLASSLDVESVLSVFKLLDYPRKNKYIYPTAVMFRGHHYSVKVYSKHPEVIKNDHKVLIKQNTPESLALAEKLYQESLNVLRFEITFRHEQLKNLYHKKVITYLDLLDTQFLINTENTIFGKLTSNLNRSFMDDEDAMERLKQLYGNKKAVRLFTFKNSFFSKDSHQKQLIKSNLHSSSIWRNLRDLKNADVGLPIDNISAFVDLSIPSNLVVNPDNKQRPQ